MKQSKQEKKPKATAEKLPIENLTMTGCYFKKQKLINDFYESFIENTDNFWLNDKD